MSNCARCGELIEEPKPQEYRGTIDARSFSDPEHAPLKLRTSDVTIHLHQACAARAMRSGAAEVPVMVWVRHIRPRSKG